MTGLVCTNLWGSHFFLCQPYIESANALSDKAPNTIFEQMQCFIMYMLAV